MYACLVWYIIILQVQYNQAFVLMKLGRNVEAMDELTKAKTKSANYSESRHKMIAPALESMRVRHLTRTPHSISTRITTISLLLHLS